MIVPQGIKKMVTVAEKQIDVVGAQVTDTSKYALSASRRTTSSRSLSKDEPTLSTSSTEETILTKSETLVYTNKGGSLMANTLLWTHLLPPMPVIASAMFRHYSKGPAAKSWTLSTNLTIAIIRDFLNRSTKITVEDIQKISTTKKLPVPSGLQRRKFIVPNDYRRRAGAILKKQFTPLDEERIGWDWEKDRESSPPIKGEWLETKGDPSDPCKQSVVLYLHGGAYYLGCYGIYRQFLGRVIKHSKGRTCSINYRLAPQHPFPAAVEDALATYLYLIDPSKDEEFEPISPKKIVISGDSAGGGLTFALLIAIRDAKLPMPAGAMTLSPWMDLTHSLPSILTNMMTDYLPPTGFKHAHSAALDYTQLPVREVRTKEGDFLTVPEDESHGRSSIDGVPSVHGEDIYRVQFYAANNALKIPMVSPIFDRKNLRGLPRLLVQCGTAERLRDESIYSALKGSNSFPGANEVGNEIKGEPTHITLETFTDQPHVFHLLFSSKSVSRAIRNLAAFFRQVTESPYQENLPEAKLKKKAPEYITSERLVIRNIDHRGKTTDIKETTLKNFTKEDWKDWNERLARPSIKERIDIVNDYYENKLKQNNQEITH